MNDELVSQPIKECIDAIIGFNCDYIKLIVCPFFLVLLLCWNTAGTYLKNGNGNEGK